MKQYATYEYYQSEFGGTKIDKKPLFNNLCKKATIRIDNATSNRIEEDNVNEIIKSCACELCEILFSKHEQDTKDVVASETVGPHTITYKKEVKSSASYEQEINTIIRTYLADTGLLFRGIHSEFI